MMPILQILKDVWLSRQSYLKSDIDYQSNKAYLVYVVHINVQLWLVLL